MEKPNDRYVFIRNTKFIFKTNFAGNPDNDKFGSRTRKGNIIIPDEAMARELAEEGFNVRTTTPKEGEEEGFMPKNFVSIILNFDSDVAKSRPPHVYMVSGDNDPRELFEDTVGEIDNTYVLNVNVTLEKSYSKRYDRWLLYIKTMYVEQDMEDDPFASIYAKRGIGNMPEDDI